MTNKLALKGGTPVIPAGKMKSWPPIDDIDRKMVMDSLNQTSHAFGPNCVAFEKEFAAWKGSGPWRPR